MWGQARHYGDVILTALASRELEKLVKTALARQQMFHVTSYRNDTPLRLRVVTTGDDKLASSEMGINVADAI